MITKHLTLVTTSDGDVQGAYLDNELYCSNTTIQDILNLIDNHHLEATSSFEVCCSWLVHEMAGDLPNSIVDIPEEVRRYE